MNNHNNRKGYFLAGVLIALAAILIIGIVKLQEQDKLLRTTNAAVNEAVNFERMVEEESSGQEPAPLEEDQMGEADSLYLLDHLPFKEEEVSSIKEEEVSSISVIHSGIKIEVPTERQYVILQSLRFTDMQAAVTDESPLSEQIILQFNLTNQRVIEVPYSMDNNAYEVAGKAYYADDQVLLLMHGLIRPESELGVYDTFEEKARLEMEQLEEQSEPQGIELEQITVDDLLFIDWEERLKTEIADWEISYYDHATGEVREARKFKDGIIQLNNKIIFSGGSHETPGGVKVGLTTTEVNNKLDADPRKLPGKWSYRVGDYFRFHLYFDDSKVKYMVLTQPL
ncbi:hypothetical protein [Paenibacillus lentus]|uniref:Uncharacterized protein n=1 Tax=Paenibacillus lentus TaxID=1338368 RepID=A0A3S8RRB2_9BACL|nr:hypothetical protein [Paenibacillus lentus]AZK45478.1 hypothetical protein EIM92_04090 [Paenibacillus lentus]